MESADNDRLAVLAATALQVVLRAHRHAAVLLPRPSLRAAAGAEAALTRLRVGLTFDRRG